MWVYGSSLAVSEPAAIARTSTASPSTAEAKKKVANAGLFWAG
jgi:hypothetical protein